jgi:histone demethylase JARID1
MVDFMPQGGPSTGATITTFRVTADHGIPEGASPAPRSRMSGVVMPPANGAQLNGMVTIPLSARQAQPLDLATVERRGYGAPNNQPPKANRMFGLKESPTYRPTAEQFKDPVQYIQSIREEAQKYGIVKIIPPDSWNPSFAIDTEVCASQVGISRRYFKLATFSSCHMCRLANIHQRFHFRTRRQELNSVEGGVYPCTNHVFLVDVLT